MFTASYVARARGRGPSIPAGHDALTVPTRLSDVVGADVPNMDNPIIFILIVILIVLVIVAVARRL